MSERTAKGTPDGVPAVIETDATSRDVQPRTHRHHADRVAVGWICRSNRQTDQKGGIPDDPDIWRRADELAGPSPTALVQSLALTVVLCEVDLRYRQALCGPLTTSAPRDLHGALNSVTKRYLAAVKGLALVQRLGLPDIQVNIAGNQVVANG
jgi:hypothetical protein